jgi:hypothetical protein
MTVSARIQRFFLLLFRFVLRGVPFLVLDLFVDFACADSRRFLLTVRAAISFARFVLRPRRCADSLMCSYCRFRFALLTPRGASLPPACPTIGGAGRKLDVTSLSTRGHFISSLIAGAVWVFGALLLVRPMERTRTASA